MNALRTITGPLSTAGKHLKREMYLKLKIKLQSICTVKYANIRCFSSHDNAF